MTAIEMTLDLQAWSLAYLIRSHGELHSQKEKKSEQNQSGPGTKLDLHIAQWLCSARLSCRFPGVFKHLPCTRPYT